MISNIPHFQFDNYELKSPREQQQCWATREELRKGKKEAAILTRKL